jgi:hypothetical protein
MKGRKDSQGSWSLLTEHHCVPGTGLTNPPTCQFIPQPHGEFPVGRRKPTFREVMQLTNGVQIFSSTRQQVLITEKYTLEFLSILSNR